LEELEADQPSPGRLVGEPTERRSTDEVSGEILHVSLETGLERRGRVVELVAVERHAGLESERVACAQSGRAEPLRLAGREQAGEERLRVAGGAGELEAGRSRVAGRRDEQVEPRELHADDTEALREGQRSARETLEHPRRGRALERDQRRLAAAVLEDHVGGAVGQHPRAILLDARGIDADEELLL